MKKTYIKPSVKAVEVKFSQLMTMSDAETGTKFNSDETTNNMDSFAADFEEENI